MCLNMRLVVLDLILGAQDQQTTQHDLPHLDILLTTLPGHTVQDIVEDAGSTTSGPCTSSDSCCQHLLTGVACSLSLSCSVNYPSKPVLSADLAVCVLWLAEKPRMSSAGVDLTGLCEHGSSAKSSRGGHLKTFSFRPSSRSSDGAS